MKSITLIDKIINFISECKAVNVIIIATIVIISCSIPLVYVFSLVWEQEYTSFLTIVSIVLPILLTPIVGFIVVAFSRNLKYYKKNLAEETLKNKQNDILLFEQARFVLMGEMMANISHQWKQPLNNVGLAIVATKLTDSEEQIERNFDIMEENISYLSNTINDFLSFFDKKTPSETRPIGNILDEVESIMRAQIKSKGIRLSINIDNKLKSIEMTSAISQVLLNLLNNAKDAIDPQKKEKEIILYFKALTDGFEIRCCDNGLGIEEKIVNKIFDPYFTTKAKSQGTGIGMYMSKEIITKVFHGTIVLDDSTKNTCFKINIPCSKNCQMMNEKGRAF